MNPGAERSGTIVAAGKTCTIPQSSSAPPVARLTMSAQGKTASENGTLNLTISSGQTVTVQLSAARSTVDTGVPNAMWFIDNFIGPGGSETSWDFSTAGTHPIRLDVTNSDGTTASAYAEIMITIGP
jgi:plastocyanin